MLTLRLIDYSNDAMASSGHDLVISAESIVLGRAEDAQLQLDGAGINSQHARIFVDGEGLACLEALGDSRVFVDGHAAAIFRLKAGQRFDIGDCTLLVESIELNGPPTMTISVSRHASASSQSGEARVVSMESSGLSKRRMSAWLATVVFIVGFLVPLATFYSPSFETWQASMHFSLSGLLSPGRLSSGHEAFGMKCSSCHEQAFAGVTDRACKECHTQVAVHLATAGEASGEVSVSEVKCVSCHASHEGKTRGQGEGVTQCVACHQRKGGTVAKYEDFSRDHPAFHLSVRDGGTVHRLPDSGQAAIVERPGLKFSHRKHLAKEGVSTPEGDTVLKCANCHKPDISGRGFVEMRMAETCQQSRCHTLRFSEPMRGKVPHVAIGALMDRVRNAFLNARLEDVSGVSVASIRSLSTTADADALAYVEKSLLTEEKGKLQCRLCHEAEESGNPAIPWKIAPVATRHKWHAKADFDHSRHATESCSYCHDKAKSETSGDVSIPTIENCRECHAGKRQEPVKVRSYCESCHRYHRLPAEQAR